MFVEQKWLNSSLCMDIMDFVEGNEMKTTSQLYNFHNLSISNGLFCFICMVFSFKYSCI